MHSMPDGFKCHKKIMIKGMSSVCTLWTGWFHTAWSGRLDLLSKWHVRRDRKKLKEIDRFVLL